MNKILIAIMELISNWLKKPKEPTAKEMHDEQAARKERSRKAEHDASAAGSAGRLRNSKYNRDNR